MSAKRAGYLQDYEKLRKGKHLKNYWSNTAVIAEKKYSTIGVEAIAIERISDKKGVTAEICKEWLRNALSKALSGLGTHRHRGAC